MVPRRDHPRVPQGGTLSFNPDRRAQGPRRRPTKTETNQERDQPLKLITKPQMETLLENGSTHYRDHKPVVKLFTPDASGTWLIGSADPEDPDLN